MMAECKDAGCRMSSVDFAKEEASACNACYARAWVAVYLAKEVRNICKFLAMCMAT